MARRSSGGSQQAAVESNIQHSPDEYSTTIKKKGKRKIETEKVDGQPVEKKVRRSRGRLEKLSEMPEDIGLTIFSFLKPLDLLHLSWTSKALRSIICSNKSVWKSARGNVPGLPPCPDDLNEAQYANMMFNKHCIRCLKATGKLVVIWRLRTRLCADCINNDFSDDSTWELREEVAKYLPTIQHRLHGRRREKIVHHKATYKKWMAELKTASDKRIWVATKVKQEAEISLAETPYLEWFKLVERELEQKNAEIFAQRQQIIIDHLKTIGWEDELSRINSDHGRSPIDLEEVQKACKKKLTPKALQNLEPTLITFMAHRKAGRLENERKNGLRKVFPVMKQALDAYYVTLDANSIYPEIGDVFRHRIAQEVVENALSLEEPTVELFEPLVSALPMITAEWLQEAKEKLIALAGNSSLHEFDPEHFVDLATTIFRCTQCSNKLGHNLTFPGVLMHNCAIKRKLYHPMMPELNVDEAVLATASQKIPWNAQAAIIFDQCGFQNVSSLIKSIGLDPVKVTRAELNALDPIYECVECNSPTEGRLMMKWATVHVHKDLPSFCARDNVSRITDEKELEVIRFRMTEDAERTLARKDFKGLVCTHCKLRGNIVDLTDHIIEELKCSEPNKYIVPVLDSLRVPPGFWMWPPK